MEDKHRIEMSKVINGEGKLIEGIKYEAKNRAEFDFNFIKNRFSYGTKDINDYMIDLYINDDLIDTVSLSKKDFEWVRKVKFADVK